VADEPITCPKCGWTPQLPNCDGDGHIFIDPDDDTKTRMCPKMRTVLIRQHLRRHLDPGISNIPYAKNGTSPLFKMAGVGEPPELDRTGENLRLRIRWRKLLPHLKFALGCKGPEFFFRIITDQQIKNVYVGNEHYHSRSKNRRDEDESVCNSIGDLMGDADLVIIKLGYIGHANRAAAGALKEALLIREASNKAVWIVDDPEHSWTHSRDSDVEHYIGTRFETVPLEGIDPGPSYEDPTNVDVGIEVTEEDEPEEEYAQEEPFEIQGDFDLPGGGGGRR
jgi:hypothetical protein